MSVDGGPRAEVRDPGLMLQRYPGSRFWLQAWGNHGHGLK